MAWIIYWKDEDSLENILKTLEFVWCTNYRMEILFLIWIIYFTFIYLFKLRIVNVRSNLNQQRTGLTQVLESIWMKKPESSNSFPNSYYCLFWATSILIMHYIIFIDRYQYYIANLAIYWKWEKLKPYRVLLLFVIDNSLKSFHNYKLQVDECGLPSMI